MPEDKEARHGKKPNQKLKPYLVMQYLLKNSDENHVVSAPEIVSYLQDDCGIEAERRSVYKDIEEINKAMLIVENGIDIFEAEEWLEEDTDNEEKFIVYDPHRKGFYVSRRMYDLYDIRLMAECIYSAKFLEEGQSDRLADIVCSLVSEEEAKQIRHNAFLTDRIKTDNKNVLNNIVVINEAMRNEREHKPEKISFKYLKHSISDLKKQAERRNGATYIVSPFALLINDGNYYLLAFDDRAKKMLTYCVDRMKNVSPVGEPREGKEEFDKIDMKTYTQRVFAMFGGEQTRVTIRFINPLLDTVVDRFGTKGAIYMKVDDSHFTVNVPIEISKQFFSWVCGFGKKAKIVSPQNVIEDYTKFLDEIRSMY